MNAAIYAVAMLAGWCGTPWPRRWPIPFPWPPKPEPDPPPCPVCGNIISTLAGLGIVVLFAQVLDAELSIAGAGVVGFVGGRFVGDLYNAATLKRG